MMRAACLRRCAGVRRWRLREIIDEKREKTRTENRSLHNTSTDSKKAAFVILMNHASAPVKKKKLRKSSKARRWAAKIFL